MDPMRERRAHFETDTGLVDEILYEGTLRMRTIAQETMREVRAAMGIDKAMKRMRRAVEKREKARARAANPES